MGVDVGGVFHWQPRIGFAKSVARVIDVRCTYRRPQKYGFGGQIAPEHTSTYIRVQSLDGLKILTSRKIRVKNPIYKLVVPRAEVEIEMVIDDAAVNSQPDFVATASANIFDVRQ